MRMPPKLLVAAVVLLVSASFNTGAETEPTVVDTLFVGYGAREIAVNPLTDRAFVANEPGRSVAIIDINRNSVIETVRLHPLFAEEVAVNPLTNRIYVGARLSFHYPNVGLIVTIDGCTNSVTGFVAIGSGQVECDVDSFTNRIYCIAAAMLGMVVLDGETDAVLDRVPGPRCRSIGVDPVATRVYMSDQGDWVTAVDAEHQQCVEPVYVRGATQLAIDPSAARVYVTQFSEDQLTVIDGVTNETVAVPTGDAPFDVTANPMTGRVYVTHYLAGTVSVIDGGAIVATVEVGRLPQSVAVNPLTGLVYVVNEMDGTVSIIEDLDPSSPPQKILADRITRLMVAAGGAGGRLQEALAHVQTESYEKAAHSLLAFSEEIESGVLLPSAIAERLATEARAIIVMMIGN